MIGATDEVTIRTPGGSVTDAEGRTTRGTTDLTVWGRADELSARDVAIAAQVGQTHDVAVKVDLDVAVTDQAEVVLSTPVRLAGTYKVDAVRTTRRHLRLLCSRTTIAQ